MTERIREALQFLDASDRDTWLRMGMAIKSELADLGFDVWEAWSLQAESFNPKDAKAVWKSIRTGGKVTIGTLYFEAKANGWRDDGFHQAPTPEAIAERRRIAAERAAKEEADQAKQHAEAATRAAAILAETYPGEHPYLLKKHIKPYGAQVIEAEKVRAIAPNLSPVLTGLLLVLPMWADDALHSLQFITADGIKRPLTGGRKQGCFHILKGDSKDPRRLICEGFATGASLHEATGLTVIIAFDAGNLLPVAKAVRAKLPDKTLILCADDDHATPGNPGLTKATEAARAVGGMVAVPDFGRAAS